MPLSVVLVLVAAILVGVARPATAEPLPTAAVGIGDSLASGESAGAYDPRTDRPGNLCHRSAVSQLQRAALPGVDVRINLACSGAVSDNVRLGGTPRYGEPPQAEQLRALAHQHRVTLIVVTLGANDLDFAGLVLDCVRAYFLLGPRCQDTWTPKLAGVLTGIAPRVTAALADLRAVMREAGYADGAYQLVVQSYPSPVTGRNRYLVAKALQGCPIRDDDAEWAREVLVPQLAAMLMRVAEEAGARFLDLSRSVRGHEVCAEGIDRAQEWVKGISINLAQLANGLGPNLVQESLHPNALGHAHLARCLTAFTTFPAQAAACTAGYGSPDLDRDRTDPAPRTLTRPQHVALNAFRL